MQHVFIAGFRWMTEIADMVVIGRGSGLIDFARVPVAALACGLWSEVHPYTELRLAQPRRVSGIVPGDGFPRRLIGAGSDGKIHLYLRKRGGVLHGERVRRLRLGHVRKRLGLRHLLCRDRKSRENRYAQGNRQPALHDIAANTKQFIHEMMIKDCTRDYRYFPGS